MRQVSYYRKIVFVLRGVAGFAQIWGVDKIFGVGRAAAFVAVRVLARAFSPPGHFGLATWGCAPGYDSAGLQPAVCAPAMRWAAKDGALNKD